jgi:glycosyltransferase involved in cell wall biosynthesis
MAKIQVLIPTYNCAQYIGETLESVLNQDCDADIVVVDNASTDDTASVVANYPTVGYVRNPKNIGAIPNHNRCLELATGEYIKLLSADDVLLPGVLRQQMDVLDCDPAVGLVTCNYIITDSDLEPTGKYDFPAGRHEGRKIIEACARKMVNLVGGPSNVLMRRELAVAGRFDESLKWLGDLEFFCQVLQHCDYQNIDVPGFLYRRHETTHSNLGCPRHVRLHDEAIFVRRYQGGAAAFGRVHLRWLRAALQGR